MAVRALVAAVAGALLTALAQEATFRVDVNLVTVPVQVIAADGAPARGLTREDFVLIDGGEPRRIDSAWFETDVPLTIAILLDLSGSQQPRAAQHRQTLAAFLRRVLRPTDRVVLISVAADVTRMESLNDPPGAPFGEQCSRRTITFPGDARPTVISACGDTPLWNAVWSAARLELQRAEGRKALLILSDGLDTGSTHTLPQAVAEVHRSEALVYAIQYPRQVARRSSIGLQRLAEESGGLRFLAPEDESYEAIFARIEDDLRNQYVIGFRPAPGAAGFRPIEVRTTREGLRVRARAGYLAR